MAQMGGVNSKEDTVKLSVSMKFTDAIAKVQTFFLISLLINRYFLSLKYSFVVTLRGKYSIAVIARSR